MTDRLTLLRDTSYFARELRKRIEALEDMEGNGRVQSYWQQAAALVGRVGRFTGEQALSERRDRERAERAQRIREALER